MNDAQATREAYEFAQFRLAEQMRAVEGVDSKAERVLAVALGIAGLLAALVTLTVEQADGGASTVALVYGGLVLVAFAAVATFFYLGFRMGEWEIGPDNDEFLRVTTTHDVETVRTWLVEWMVRSYEENEALLAAKVHHFIWALRCTAIEGAISMVGAAAVALARIAG